MRDNIKIEVLLPDNYMDEEFGKDSYECISASHGEITATKIKVEDKNSCDYNMIENEIEMSNIQETKYVLWNEDYVNLTPIKELPKDNLETLPTKCPNEKSIKAKFDNHELFQEEITTTKTEVKQEMCELQPTESHYMKEVSSFEGFLLQSENKVEKESLGPMPNDKISNRDPRKVTISRTTSRRAVTKPKLVQCQMQHMKKQHQIKIRHMEELHKIKIKQQQLELIMLEDNLNFIKTKHKLELERIRFE